MRKNLLKSLSLIGICAALSAAAPVWKPLFNGTNFNGWYIVGAQTYWSIDPADSAIVGSSTTSTPYTMVFSDSTFDQFTIKYSYRLRAGCSGFFFRSIQTTAAELVSGIQVEAKFTGGRQSEVGSLYVHPAPGWVRQHSQAYSDRIARTPNTVYQDVILTVKRPYFYVNVNGYQAVGETDPAELTLGGQAAWQYVSTNANLSVIQNPGKFGLQIHGGQATMDVRFKNIAILEGCGDSTSTRYDGRFAPGLTKQPAVYKDNGTCMGTAVDPRLQNEAASHFIGVGQRVGNELVLAVKYSGPHDLELTSLRGQVLFSASSPSAKEYHIALPAAHGVYVATLKTKNQSVARKIAVQ